MKPVVNSCVKNENCTNSIKWKIRLSPTLVPTSHSIELLNKFLYVFPEIIHLYTAMDWTVSSQNSYFEDLTPNVIVFEDRAFMELNKIKLGHKGGVLIQ